jgi:methoxymalonate biosynthesis acyl carrier protein
MPTRSAHSDATGVIRDFIASRYPKYPFDDGDDIFARGFVNSLFAMELVMFIEKTFDITLGNNELQFDNFRTVKSMAALVARQAVSVCDG